MRYLFDTDVVSNLFKKQPSPNLLTKLKALPKSSQFISTITIFEIVYGAQRCSNTQLHLTNLTQILLPSVNVLAFDREAAFKAGELRAEIEKTGKSVSLADLQIAAIAIVNDCLLITGNLKHFQKIPQLSAEDWL